MAKTLSVSTFNVFLGSKNNCYEIFLQVYPLDFFPYLSPWMQ